MLLSLPWQRRGARRGGAAGRPLPPLPGVGARGNLLLETVVAVTAFTLVGTAVLGGLSTTHRAGAVTEAQSVAENIARNQMEHVFSLPYQEPPSDYPPVSTPPGYSVAAVAQEHVPGDPRIERVVVTVTRGGRDLLVIETLRVRE